MEIIKKYVSDVIKNNLDENGKLNEFATLVVVLSTISLLYTITRSKQDV